MNEFNGSLKDLIAFATVPTPDADAPDAANVSDAGAPPDITDRRREFHRSPSETLDLT